MSEQEFKPLLDQAQIARKQGNRVEALAFYEKALAIQPSHPTLPADIAVELRELARFDEAIAFLEAHAEYLNPALKWHHQGLIFLAQSNHEDAIRCYEAGILANPTDPRCYQAMIGEFLKFGLYKRAQEIIEQAECNITTPNRFYLYKIRSLMNQGLYEDAISTCEQMLLQYPHDMTIAHHLIDLQMRAGNFFESEKLLDQVVASSIEDQQYFARQRSELAKARFNLPHALELAYQGLALNPSNRSFRMYLALVELLMGSTVFAKQELNDLQAQVPITAYRKIWPSAIGNIQGRLYSEMRTNPFAQALLAKAWKVAKGAERISAIADVLKAEPSYIGSAISLLCELRSQGAFSHAARQELIADPNSQESSLALKIPKTIIQFWDESTPPEDVVQMIESWRLKNPDFDHLLFDDEKAEQFLLEHCDAKVVRAFRMSNYPAMRADVFRLAYLSIKGGVYADADDLCRHSIANWFAIDVELVLIQEHLGSIGNNFMAAMPNHPFIVAALDRAVDQILGKQGDIWFASGPGTITILFCNYYLNELRQLRIAPTINIMDCYTLGQRISIQLPRQYKQTTKSWSSPKNQNKPIYRLANSFIRRTQ